MSFFRGNTLRHWTSRLLASDGVFRVVQSTLHSSLDARRAIDRNADRLLSMLDLPTRRDIERLESDLEDLDDRLADLQLRITKLTMSDRAPRL